MTDIEIKNQMETLELKMQLRKFKKTQKMDLIAGDRVCEL